MGIRTDYRDEFRAAFTAYDHPLLVGSWVFDHCSNGVEELHFPDHDVADIPSYSQHVHSA